MSRRSAAQINPPIVPPHVWFNDPQLSALTPLTVTEHGRLVGHLASWDTSPPRSQTRYARFHVGEVLCDDGVRVSVGRMTLGAPGVAHFDHTGTCVADVAAGEDDHGIWIAGALRPDVTAGQVNTLLASPPFGDWRRIGRGVELVGVLSVPGLDGSDPAVLAELALVASASFRLPLRPRLTAAVGPVGGPVTARRKVADFIAASIGRPTSAQRAAAAVLAARVDALVGSTRAERDHDRLVASLAGSGWVKAREAERRAALYAQVHGHRKGETT